MIFTTDTLSQLPHTTLPVIRASEFQPMICASEFQNDSVGRVHWSLVKPSFDIVKAALQK